MSAELRNGQTVRLNEALTIVEDRGKDDLLAASSWLAREAGWIGQLKVQ